MAEGLETSFFEVRVFIVPFALWGFAASAVLI